VNHQYVRPKPQSIKINSSYTWRHRVRFRKSKPEVQTGRPKLAFINWPTLMSRVSDLEIRCFSGVVVCRADQIRLYKYIPWSGASPHDSEAVANNAKPVDEISSDQFYCYRHVLQRPAIARLWPQGHFGQSIPEVLDCRERFRPRGDTRENLRWILAFEKT
jgi:hypothetical protein